MLFAEPPLFSSIIFATPLAISFAHASHYAAGYAGWLSLSLLAFQLDFATD
jgi:hypothetical protein